MKINKWEVIQGASNLGEDDIRVAALKVGIDGIYTGITKIAYCAYGGLKILEVKGIPDLEVDDRPYGECEATHFEKYLEDEDWEVGFFAKMYGCDGRVLVSINDCEMFSLCFDWATTESDVSDEYVTEDKLEVVSSEEYMADQYDELDIDLLKIFSYI